MYNMDYTRQDFMDWGEFQGQRWDDGEPLECLVHFTHDGKVIVNPYSYTQGDPADIFGTKNMDAWIAESAELFDDFAADQ